MAHELTCGAIDPCFVERVPAAVAALSPTVADVPTANRQWVFYGSVPIGASGDGSDLDAMLLYQGEPPMAPHRRSVTWGSVPVTLYVLSYDCLFEDGAQRRFGGYFSLKLLRPYVSDRPTLDGGLAELTARFLGPFSEALAASCPRSSWDADELLAHAHLASLYLYPHAAGYLARLMRDPSLFTRVWRHESQVHVSALESAGLIRHTTADHWIYTRRVAIPDLDREQARCAARFWGFGSTCHASGPDFPDAYFLKTEQLASPDEQRAAVKFLHTLVARGFAA